MGYTKGEWEKEFDNPLHFGAGRGFITNCKGKGFKLHNSTKIEELRKLCQYIDEMEALNTDLLEACIHAHDALLCLHVCELDKKRCDSLRAELRQAITKAEGK